MRPLGRTALPSTAQRSEAAAWRRAAAGRGARHVCAGSTTRCIQLVFGVQNAADAALDAVRRLQARFPECDIAVVVDPTLHGPNRKVGNLINMLAAARHDVLVIADSDLHVRPDYLDRLAAAFDEPGTGLVTTLYAGLPATNRACGPARGHPDHPWVSARRAAGPSLGAAGLPGRDDDAVPPDARPHRRIRGARRSSGRR